MNTASQTQHLASLDRAWRTARQHLDSYCVDGSHWTGELSTSSLSTATAISSLVQMQLHGNLDQIDDPALLDSAGGKPLGEAVQAAIGQGCEWLSEHQNADGGFGDTDRSHSNIATTFLVQAAWKLAEFDSSVASQNAAATGYITAQGSWDGLRRRYGKDKTFVVPILSNCALAGMVPWKRVPRLPFEAAWLPQDWYRMARMPVVSYAIPALVAIGQASFHHCPPGNPLVRWIRRRAQKPTLDVLRRMQPASGGYLEATPLTSFVLMNLASIGHAQLPVSRDCLRFLLDSMLPDGSWPIDTNLATWVTSLSLTAMSRRGPVVVTPIQEPTTTVAAPAQDDPQTAPAAAPSSHVAPAMVRWLLDCQHKKRHPFTGATPGGWGWTNLSGAVPDADDTPAAILALQGLDMSHPSLAPMQKEVYIAIGAGLQWLRRLQNRNGGMPTFCRGWGKLPFDRSGTDLTAHALRAVHACLPDLDTISSLSTNPIPTRRELDRLTQRGLKFLRRNQLPDGSWLPLWFGNQDRPEEDNPVYGTSKVLLAYADLGLLQSPEAIRGVNFLKNSQNDDGGWGGGMSVSYPTKDASFNSSSHTNQRSSGGNAGGTICSTIEETALAVEALVQCGGHPARDRSIIRATEWLCERMRPDNLDASFPIGFYFAKLWYHERLYPSIFSLAALGTVIRHSGGTRSEPPG